MFSSFQSTTTNHHPCRRRRRQLVERNRGQILLDSFLLSPSRTCCDNGNRSDADTSSSSSATPPSPTPRHELIKQPPHPRNPYKRDIERLQSELDQPCQACLYTGVATCVGLAGYFAHFATEEATLKRNRRFLWICSAGSLVAGAYRWHLG